MINRAWNRVYVPGVMAIAAVPLLVGGCAPRGHVLKTYESQPWSEAGRAGRRIVTPHFEIYSTLGDSTLEGVIPGFLEASYEQYRQVLPDRGESDARMITYVFGTRPEWEQFTRRNFPQSYPVYRRIQQGGFAEGGTSVSFYTTRSSTLATLAHEGWHQYVASRFGGRMPAWLNEGLACYCECAYFDGDKPIFTPMKNTFRTSSLRSALQQDKLLTVRELVTTDAGDVISHDQGSLTHTYYAQSWALITMLRQGRFKTAFDEMIRDYRNGTFDARVSAALITSGRPAELSHGEAVFLAYFGASPDDIADEYYDHMVRLVAY